MVKIEIVEEFSKVARAFRRVKEDIHSLYSSINESFDRHRSQDRKISELYDEIDRLKKTLRKEEIVIVENKTKEEQPKLQEERKKIIVGNIESKKFHYDNCPFAKNIKGDNKLAFDNIEQAVKNGYNECSCIRE